MNTTDTCQSQHSNRSEIQSDQRSKRIILALRKIMQQMDFHSRRINKCYGLTVPQIICLYEIYENGAMTISRLSKQVFLSMSTLVGIIDRLEEKDFINRTRDTKDRRNIFINITIKGNQFVNSSPYLLHNRVHENLRTLPEKEQEELSKSVELLVNILMDI